MDKTKVKNFIKALIFNIVETLTIFLIGLCLEIGYNHTIALMLMFLITRLLCGKPKHYKKAYNCFIWSTLTFSSVYLTTDCPLTINILLTIFAAIISTGKADWKDMYMWKGTNSKYTALIDIVSLSPNNSVILEHEEYWRKNYPMRFEIFRLYFRERKTYEDIMELKDLSDSKLIQRECRSIYDILERPLNLPPVQ